MGKKLNDKLLQFIDGLNGDGDVESIELVFGDFYTFLSVIRKNGLLNNLEPFNNNFNYNGEVIQSEILNMMLQNDKDYAYPMIANNCCDDVNYDNGEYYYVGTNYGKLEDLSAFFNDNSRSGYSHEIIARAILSGEYAEMFTINDFDAYGDVVTVLNLENQERLKKYFLKHHNGFEFEDGTTLGVDNIDDSINDQSYFDELYQIDDDIEPELFNIYTQAYNNAWESEQSKHVFNALEEFFDMSNIWKDMGNGDWKLNLKIRNFEKIIDDYLVLQGQDKLHKINYHGYFEHLVTNLMGYDKEYNYLTFHIVEYPSNVGSEINELFGDYI